MKNNSYSQQPDAPPSDSNEHFREFTDNISDWIWEVNSTGTYIYSNRKVMDILGYSPEEIIGRTPFDFMPLEEAARVRTIFLKMVSARIPFSFLENSCLHKTGRRVVLETSGVPYFDHTGNLMGYRGIDRDITERLQLVAQEKKACIYDSLMTLAGGIAHEFNNALHILSGCLELMQNNLLDPQSFQLFKQESRKSIQRLSDLSNQLLAYAQGGKYHPERLHWNELAQKAAGKTQKDFIGPGIRVSFDFAASEPAFLGDAAQLSMVLTALLTNAAEAIKGSGHIHIQTAEETAHEDLPPRYLDMKPGRYASLIVADDGGGMNQETQCRLFEPFFTTKFQGRGLGMAAVYGIVKNHGGYIHVESALQKGTTIRIFLPAI